MFISTGELITQSWRIYFKNLKYLLPYVGLNILLVLVCFGLPIGVFYAANRTNAPALIALGAILYILGLIVMVYGGLLLHVALLKAARNAVENKVVGISEVLKKSRPLILPTLGTTLLKVFLIYLGLFAFIVPGIIMLVRYAFAEMAVVYDEPKEGAAAIRISRALVKGRWWGMLGRWIVSFLVPVMIIMIIGYIFSLAFKGPLVNAQGILPEKIAEERIKAPTKPDTEWNYNQEDFTNTDFEKLLSESEVPYNLYGQKDLGLSLYSYRSPFTPRYFAFLGAVVILSVLIAPYYLVAAGLMYTSAKQNQIKK